MRVAGRRKSRRVPWRQLGRARSACVKWKVEPVPGPALSTHIVPPISSASRLLMASPSPVPPYLRVVALSAWLNDWNSRLMPASAQADAGVAHREVQQAAFDRSARRLAARTVSTTSPASVNLTALLSRFSSTWRSRVTSPTMADGGTSALSNT